MIWTPVKWPLLSSEYWIANSELSNLPKRNVMSHDVISHEVMRNEGYIFTQKLSKIKKYWIFGKLSLLMNFGQRLFLLTFLLLEAYYNKDHYVKLVRYQWVYL